VPRTVKLSKNAAGARHQLPFYCYRSMFVCSVLKMAYLEVFTEALWQNILNMQLKKEELPKHLKKGSLFWGSLKDSMKSGSKPTSLYNYYRVKKPNVDIFLELKYVSTCLFLCRILCLMLGQG